MEQCCVEFVYNKCEPTRPRNGVFSEIHTCPTCDKRIRVTFECSHIMGDNLMCSVLVATCLESLIGT